MPFNCSFPLWGWTPGLALPLELKSLGREGLCKVICSVDGLQPGPLSWGMNLSRKALHHFLETFSSSFPLSLPFSLTHSSPQTSSFQTSSLSEVWFTLLYSGHSKPCPPGFCRYTGDGWGNSCLLFSSSPSSPAASLMSM